MSKVVKGVRRAVKSVIGGGFRIVKKLATKAWKNKFIRVALIAAAAVFAGPAIQAFAGQLGAGATLGQAAGAAWTAGTQALGGTVTAIGNGLQTLAGGTPAGAEAAASTLAPAAETVAAQQLPSSFLMDPATGKALTDVTLGGVQPAVQKGIMSRALDFAASPGGGLVTSAALKLAGGAMADRGEAKLREDEIARQRANTAVGGINTNWTVGQPLVPPVPQPGVPQPRPLGVMSSRLV